MGTAEFQAATHAAKAWMAVEGHNHLRCWRGRRPTPCVGCLCSGSSRPSLGELGEDTRKEHRRRLEEMMREPSSPSTPQFRFGDYPVAKLETKHIKVLRDRKADAPTAANHRLNTLRLLFNWAIDNDNKGGLTYNPGLPVHKLKTSTEGHHTWTDEEREQFKRRWAVGTMARLAYELFFTTGQRLGDVYKSGPHTIQNGTLCFTQEKNGRHNPVPMVLPVPADLQAALNATKTGQATFITKDKAGNPFSSKKSLGTWFKACCAKANCPIVALTDFANPVQLLMLITGPRLMS